jgi:hypothetical protein
MKFISRIHSTSGGTELENLDEVHEFDPVNTPLEDWFLYLEY